MGKHTHIHTYKCIHHIQRELEEVGGERKEEEEEERRSCGENTSIRLPSSAFNKATSSPQHLFGPCPLTLAL